ncbi:MAG: PAS domain S-box protein [Deltaproteobacteria bacterium]|nr:PAS domain S-box protein [Deltaproteobacteria bacterium]
MSAEIRQIQDLSGRWPESLTDRAEEIILVHDLDGTITYMNKRGRELFGKTDPMEKLNIDELVPHDHVELFRERRKRRQTGDDSPFLYEVEIKDRHGRIFHFEVSSTTISRTDDRVEILLVARDIEDRKRIEQARERLERKLAKLERLNDLGRMAGEVAHFVNGTLITIMGLASKLADETCGSGEASKRIEKIHEACFKAKELTSNLLAFAQKGGYLRKSVDINALATRVSNEFKSGSFSEHDIKLDLEEGLARVKGDESQLERALKYLVQNSMESFCNTGTFGTVILRTRTRIFEDKCEDNRDTVQLEEGPVRYVSIEVIDNGMGMEPDVLAHAFEPFYTTKMDKRRAGLGLAMVFGTAASHGGKVSIDSEPGKGTRVVVTIPSLEYLESKDKKNIGKETSNPEDEVPKNVLVIDDDTGVLEAFRLMLEQLGWNVITAGTLREAMDAVSEFPEPISLVTLDVLINGSSCKEALEEIIEVLPGAKVLLCTGYPGDEDMEELMKSGASGLLTKPFSLAMLKKEIARLFSLPHRQRSV